MLDPRLATQKHQNAVVYSRDVTSFSLVLRGSDGSYAHTDTGHYMLVKKARMEQGLARRPGASAELDHPLVGKVLIDRSGTTYTVVKVCQDWWYGRFLRALLEHDGSHRTCVIESPTCMDPGIREQADKFARDFLPQA